MDAQTTHLSIHYLHQLSIMGHTEAGDNPSWAQA